MPSKAELRKSFKEKLESSAPIIPLQNKKICEILLAHSKIQTANRIALFYPRPIEPDLLEIYRAYPSKCLFPKVTPHSLEMEFFGVASLKNLKLGFGGLLEPDSRSTPYYDWNANDLFLVPGLAFSETGARLGSGKGYFDHFLSQLPTGTAKWGVCFDFQIENNLPQETHDVRMDAVVTPSGIQVIIA